MGSQRVRKNPLEYARPRPDESVAWWRRRGTAVLAATVLWLGFVFYYTWPECAMVSYRLLVDGGVLLLWIAAAVGTGAWLLGFFRVTGPGEDESPLLRFATSAGLGLGLFSLIVLALGLSGWLDRATSIALLALGLSAGAMHIYRSHRSKPFNLKWFEHDAGWGWLGLLCVPFAGIMTAGAMMPPYFLWSPGEPHGYDVVEYHLQVPREWFELGRIVPLHHNVFSFFPFNVELHYLLAMHLRGGPWAGMYLAQFMHGAMIALAVAAACGFATNANRTATRTISPILVLIAMSTTPWLAQLGAIAYDEGGFLLFGTLAIGWAMLALRHPQRRIRRFARAGVMAGLACGCKLTALPEVLLAIGAASLVLLFTQSNPDKESPARRLLGPAAFGLAGLLVFSPWLIRTCAWSGNPVFPELPSLLGRGHFSEVQIERWHRAHSAQPAQQPLMARLRAFGTETFASWQFGYLLLPLACLSIILGWKHADVRFLGALLFMLAVFWTGFTHLQSRFFILAVPIGALLIARLPRYVGLAICAQAIIGFALLHPEFINRMKPVALGVEDYSWALPAAAENVPTNEPLTLVGDARAFFYQRPMGLLKYRTIFDADTSDGRGIIDAWAGPVGSSPEWLLIDPNELKRFARTYQPFAPIPETMESYKEPYVERR
jgi:hypothetical protein